MSRALQRHDGKGQGRQVVVVYNVLARALTDSSKNASFFLENKSGCSYKAGWANVIRSGNVVVDTINT